MVSNPGRLLDSYLQAGASWVSVHFEASPHLDRLISQIRKAGARAGVVLNPATPVASLEAILPALDFVLLMSVNPGFGGQSFIPYVLQKASQLRSEIDRRGLKTEIEIDGGVGLDNIAEVVASGVEICVAGSAVFGAEDPVSRIAELVAAGSS